MSAHILDGQKCAFDLKQKLISHIKSLSFKPGLAVIQVGDNPASKIYVTSKIHQCGDVGIQSFSYFFKTETAPEEVIQTIRQLNADPQVHGILVQLPLPEHFDPKKIINTIDPLKDVDGLHPFNLGALMTGRPTIVPCTPRGCLSLIKTYHQNLSGLKAVVLGRSILVGKPMALTLLNEDCTVIMAHSKTQDLPQLCAQADILIAAAGSPRLVKRSWVQPGAIVLDVGINRLPYEASTLVGDVDFEEVKEIAGALTPVPGGVGPMTVVSLLQNTVDLMRHQLGLKD